jgi:uncharacterized protein YbjT (DUF2867 family)
MSETRTPARVILLSGASGLIGSLVLRALLANPTADVRVIAPSRRTLPVDDPRLLVPVGDWQAADAQPALKTRVDASGPLDTWICALGTTLNQAGSRAAFRAVDLELVLRMGGLARACGAGHAIVVSSVGANAGARNFYLAVKGEAEQGLRALGFRRLDLLQPSLLLGPRQDRRTGEAWGQRLAPWFNPLLAGGLRRYRAIPAEVVAGKVLRLLGLFEPGCFAHTYDQLTV